MQITIEEILQAYKDINYKPMTGETIDIDFRFCCPLAALSLQKGIQADDIIETPFSELLPISKAFAEGFITAIDTEDPTTSLLNNDADFQNGYKNGEKILEELKTKGLL